MKTEKKLNMPMTTFSLRPNYQLKEKELLEKWKTENTFLLANNSNKQNETFCLHDGPPYANGSVHMGHALNKVLKDCVVKYNLLNGKYVDFRPGWDCHGMPTELMVEKKYGKKDVSELRQKCEFFALSQMKKQMDVFEKFGVFADWDKKYLTMDSHYERKELEVLYKMHNDGLLFFDKRPVYYSHATHTVLAESELEYMNVETQTVYLKFKLENGLHLLVWTTQPWTLLGNVAVAVNENFVYSVVSVNGEKMVTLNPEKLEYDKLEYTLKGSDLVGLKYFNPLTNKQSKVVHGNFVTMKDGTGAVHLCPQHGEEDYYLCKQLNLEYGEELLDNDGCLKGTNLYCFTEGNLYVMNKLKEFNLFVKDEKLEHSYPHDWRTKTPVFYKLTKQFFVDLNLLKDGVNNQLSKVEFNHSRYYNRLKSMMGNRKLWCLSRQRSWGLPLAVFLKEGEVFMPKDLQNHVMNLVEENGSNVWFNKNSEDLLPEKYKNMGLVKCEYTVDVWFDSGTSWHSVLNDKQADVYLEGSDQHRGWFQSSLLTSVMYHSKAPYKKLVTHGFVLDSNGQKMSKSLGNVVDPLDVSKKYNTDVLRLSLLSVDYVNDVKMGDGLFKTASEYYFKFRNTLKYFLGNMYGYNNEEFTLEEMDFKQMELNKKHMEKCKLYYEQYDFKNVVFSMLDYVNETSSQYLNNTTKSYLYEYDVNSNERKKCQMVLFDCLMSMLKTLAPLCPFMAEDVYSHLPENLKNNSSVFYEKF
jgi:isoleucyl-tRNA synthetase